jgi:hypothetical protein
MPKTRNKRRGGITMMQGNIDVWDVVIFSIIVLIVWLHGIYTGKSIQREENKEKVREAP